MLCPYPLQRGMHVRFAVPAAFEQTLWIAGTTQARSCFAVQTREKAGRLYPSSKSWSISAIQFVDRNRGWFVSSGGSIWATRDGGSTWFAQRVPVKRLGLQVFASSASNISWPSLANATWQARQATELVTVYRENIEDAVDTVPDAPSTLSVLGGQIGLAGTWHPSQWPVPGSHVQLSATTASHTEQSATSIEPYLAMRLRAGRPTVVLVDDLESAEANNETFSEAVTRAVWLAEHDHPSLAWLSSELNLPPWRTHQTFECFPRLSELSLRSPRKNCCAIQAWRCKTFWHRSLVSSRCTCPIHVYVACNLLQANKRQPPKISSAIKIETLKRPALSNSTKSATCNW